MLQQRLARQVLLATPRESSPEIDHWQGSVVTFRHGLVQFWYRTNRTVSDCWKPWSISSPLRIATASALHSILADIKRNEWMGFKSWNLWNFVYVIKAVRDPLGKCLSSWLSFGSRPTSWESPSLVLFPQDVPFCLQLCENLQYLKKKCFFYFCLCDSIKFGRICIILLNHSCQFYFPVYSVIALFSNFGASF